MNCPKCGRDHSRVAYCGSRVNALKAGLASAGIGWIEPQDRRNKAGQFMLDHGVRMGFPLDPGEVQTLLVEFCDTSVSELEQAANLLIDYCEAHNWGTMPEPFDSINPLLKLLGRLEIKK